MARTGGLEGIKIMAMDGEARDRLIIYMRRRMAEYGIKLSDLKDKPVAKPTTVSTKPERPVKYRDTKGHTWDGVGERPQWLTHAMNLGLSPSFFEVAKPQGGMYAR
jgi:DNA-binding protein H-NS